MKLAIIGLGKWGKNIQKTLEEFDDVELAVYDPSVSPSLDHPPLRKGRKIDAVLIATPGSTHAEVALPFIKQGLPVFIEKPMTTSLKDALRLEKAAEKASPASAGRTPQVFVGHLHLYNPAFITAKELVGKAGKIKYAAFEGMNWGPFRDDISAWWDWAPHDISMALELFGKPQSIQAWGEYDWAVARLEFLNTPEVSRRDSSGVAKRGSFFVTIHVSTLSSQKRKRMTVAGTKHSVAFDDTAEHPPSREATARRGKIEVHQKGQVSYLEYEKTSPLTAELQAFIQMIETKKLPKTDIQNGLDVVRILDAAERSMRKNGAKINL